MIDVTIRYINDGEELNEETLNRMGWDIEANLNALFERLSELENTVSGEVDEIPNTLVLRNNEGTSSFSEPTEGTHPLRLDDADTSDTPNTVVMRDDNGDHVYFGDGISGRGTQDDPAKVELSPREGNMLQVDSAGLYMGIEAPPDVAVLYVSPSLGDDSNIGTREEPIATIREAISRVPVNSSSTIRLRASETHIADFGVASVIQAVRTFEGYDDPYIDGDMVPDPSPTIWFYTPWLAAETGRPVIRFDWTVNPETDAGSISSFVLSAGGTVVFRGCDIVRSSIPSGVSTIAGPCIIGLPDQYNGSASFFGTILRDDAASSGIIPMFGVRGDTGNLNFSMSSIQVSDPILSVGAGIVTIGSDPSLNPTPTPVPGITKFEDNFHDNAASYITGAIKVNGVPINVLTNLTSL